MALDGKKVFIPRMSSICATLRRRYLFLQMGLASLLTMARMWPWLEVF